MPGFYPGGQRRTMVLPCGKELIGPPNRLDTPYRMHMKKCEQCKNRSLGKRIKDIPFEKSMNGTVDLRGKSKTPNTKGIKIGVGYRGGERVDGVPISEGTTTQTMWLEPEPETEPETNQDDK